MHSQYFVVLYVTNNFHVFLSLPLTPDPGGATLCDGRYAEGGDLTAERGSHCIAPPLLLKPGFRYAEQLGGWSSVNTLQTHTSYYLNAPAVYFPAQQYTCVFAGVGRGRRTPRNTFYILIN